MAEIERHIEWVIPSPSKLFTPAVTAILILLVFGFALIHYATNFTFDYLALTTAGILHGRIWQLVTYPFINSCDWPLVFNGVLILFLGSAVEREWRTGSFVLLWLVVSVVCGLAWIGISALLGRNYVGLGSASCAYGLIAVWGLLYRRKRFLTVFWAVEAQYLAWILIVIGIILGIPRPITWIWVSGALVGYLYIKLRWRVSSAGRAAPAEQTRPRGFVDID